ncbi:MAG: Uma2 family endonuclease [Hyphomonadaceae bacterium]|nr:Uma2 family endonuclease [Hyphomonadaceae bacterium]
MAQTFTTRGAEGFDRRAFTVDDVQRMLEAGVLDWDEKFELIRGEIVPMNAQLTPHAMIKSRIGRWLGSRLDEALFDVGVDVTVQLGAAALFEPDVFVAKRLPNLARAFLPAGSALLVVEVADTTLRIDRDIKAPDYAAAGVPELWVVDINKRETLVFRGSGDGRFAPALVIPFEGVLAPGFAPALSLVMTTLE